MVQTLAANQVTLGDLKRSLGLQQSQDLAFFQEWQADNPTLSQHEQQLLDRVKANFLALTEEPPLLENSVKMVVLSPLLDLAGFYQKPFRIETEKSIDLELQEADTVIQGRIDVLVLQAKLWLLVIEAKRSDFAVTRALPQALTYLLSDPGPDDVPSFGLITDGTEFLFIKASRSPVPQYANSRLFSLINPHGNELYPVLAALKSIGEELLHR